MRYQLFYKKLCLNFKNLSFFLALIFISTLLLFHSCKYEDLEINVENENYRNVMDFTANNYELGLFHAALIQVGMEEELRGKGPFTVFAPTNTAFNEMGILRESDFTKMNQDSLLNMLRYHILPERLYREDIPSHTIDNLHTNLAGKSLYLGFKYIPTPNQAYPNTYILNVNGANVPKNYQNTVVANGIIHPIEKVLKYEESIQDILQNNPSFSLFTTLLKKFGEWDRLAEKGPFTILAPSNTAFEALQIDAAKIAAMDLNAYDSGLLVKPYILNNHIFTGDIEIMKPINPVSGPYGSAIVYGSVPSAKDYVNGINYYAIGDNTAFAAFVSTVEINNEPSKFRRNSPFLSNRWTDFKAENGVVHGITNLLASPEDALRK
ncbi:fasciclin domain-containing protein [Sphingobacterium sp. HJSM2_6]|uniref:fasciclin domain-containing protein n=1 Tax=Sphingobacterium sp. HJSM2_6 TaxID=3366264 RepID=UPI003BC03ACE